MANVFKMAIARRIARELEIGRGMVSRYLQPRRRIQNQPLCPPARRHQMQPRFLPSRSGARGDG